MNLTRKSVSIIVAGIVTLAAADVRAQGVAAPADQPAPVPQRRFEPPPMPDFMLRKPDKPLTLEEMRRQADEAAERARRVKEENEKRAAQPASGR